ncbi:DNA polymerase-4 [Geothermobacter ehrlichii]|uniref:DNA polymerase IV n=1 Tax=Geothermobacter ehrlichii TaxID=213224 RepID=A0A5D3WJ22_9BACT|nr:DNA polymerase IV [Geothermobacter ehrlichii]TYO97649.1 DNA polymerase-4 [Geothermobacter ehrlichii]
MGDDSRSERVILHCDMDAFYASVEQQDRPELRGRPVLVGGHRRRGVVCACSYEARPFGVRSGMAMAKALQLCPQAAVLPVRMERYRQVSEAVFALFRQFTDRLEPLSIDEAFLDVTACRRLLGDGETIGATLRRLVRERTGLAVSVGVADNKLLAKLASAAAKPDGMRVLAGDEVETFLLPLPVERIWGVGPKTAEALHRIGVHRVAEARSLSRRQLRSMFGVQGERLYDLLRGIDNRPVQPPPERKSLGAEETFVSDLDDRRELERQLLRLAEKVCRRARLQKLAGRGATLKVRLADFSTRTRSVTFTSPVNAVPELMAWAGAALPDIEPQRPVRLLGLYLNDLTPESQLDLFGERERLRRLDEARDRIWRRFGEKGLTRASLLGLDGSVQRRQDGFEDGE